MSRPAIGPDRESAHRDRGQADSVRHLLVRQSEKPGRRHGSAEGDDLGGVKAAPPTAARFTDTVALFTALGGGWWNRNDVPPAPAGLLQSLVP